MLFRLNAGELDKNKQSITYVPITEGIVTHSLLSILLISPVRIAWFSAETCGRLRRANIMNAFIGRFGVPSALRVCDVNAVFGSSGQTGQ